jgi:hypothetical protein
LRRRRREGGGALAWALRGTATAAALKAIVDLDLNGRVAIEPPCESGRD